MSAVSSNPAPLNFRVPRTVSDEWFPTRPHDVAHLKRLVLRVTFLMVVPLVFPLLVIVGTLRAMGPALHECTDTVDAFLSLGSTGEVVAAATLTEGQADPESEARRIAEFIRTRPDLFTGYERFNPEGYEWAPDPRGNRFNLEGVAVYSGGRELFVRAELRVVGRHWLIHSIEFRRLAGSGSSCEPTAGS